ncbi:MAG TPA: MCE family protein [Pseudonocardia sp.]|jgi:virulence factor Mce-like protein
MPYVVDITGRGPSTATLARRGVLACAVMAVLVAVLLMQYRGAFRNTFDATVRLAGLGDGLAAGADVKMRGALVGSVDEVRIDPGSDGVTMHEVRVGLRPEMAAGIPAGVTARVVPTNIFGSPSVELVDPSGPDVGSRLARDAVIPENTSAQTRQLQTALNRLTTVLRALRPAELNVALTNLAQGLQGRGALIGSETGRLDRYLSTLNDHTADFTADVGLLGTELQALADAAPELLDTVDNLVVTSRTLADQQDQLADTLTGTRLMAEDTDHFLDKASDRFARVLNDGRDIAGVLRPQRELIARSLASFGQAAGILRHTFDPKVPASAQLLFASTPFQPYTARDCPRYPGLSGPNCGAPTGSVSPVLPDGVTLPKVGR